jgi:hypothetical protein
MPRIFLALALLVAARAGAVEIGLSGPSVYGGNVDGALAAARAVEATGTTWVRLNFRLDLWSAPDDATRRGPQGLTWYEAYDRLVDELTTHGVQVYGQVGGESVPGDGEPDSDDHVQRYAAAFVKIVDHFRDRVRVFETFNEPNNWRDSISKRPAVAPAYYAKELQEIYLAVKVDGGRAQDPCAQVAIVSGALFSSEDTDAADYWAQVIDAGRNQLAFDWMHEHVGSWPYDGIGYHVYVGQAASATTASVAQAAQANLDAIWAAVAARDDQAAGKKLWLSEVGWTIDQVSALEQADFLTTSFDTFAGDAHVAAAFWFTYQDFPDGRYGLYDDGGLAVANRRPAYESFTGAVAKYPPARAATFTADDAPLSLAPGETRMVTLTMQNRGSDVWSEAAQVRLGAAPGCPSAAASNAFGFVPGAGGGYANGVADARIAFGGVSVARGGSAALTFAISAPATPGDYVLGARMVRDGVAWFGDTFRRTIHVAMGGGSGGDPGDGTNGATDGAATGGALAPGEHRGCSFGGSSDGPATPLGVGLIVCALAIFRRREKPLVPRKLT